MVILIILLSDIITLVETILIENLSKHYETYVMIDDRVIGRDGKVLDTDVTVHPGEILADELEARDILKKDFAALVGKQPSHLSDLIKGKRHVSAKLALKLERHLGINASYWLRVQMAYDLFMAKKELQQA